MTLKCLNSVIFTKKCLQKKINVYIYSGHVTLKLDWSFWEGRFTSVYILKILLKKMVICLMITMFWEKNVQYWWGYDRIRARSNHLICKTFELSIKKKIYFIFQNLHHHFTKNNGLLLAKPTWLICRVCIAYMLNHIFSTKDFPYFTESNQTFTDNCIFHS